MAICTHATLSVTPPRAVHGAGAGSSRINPQALDTPLEELRRRAGDAVHVSYTAGYDPCSCAHDAAAIDAAVAAAQSADRVVVLVGLPSAFETESCDREHMRLPEQMNMLVAAVAAVAADRLVVVLLGGAPVELPWLDGVASLLYMGLGGQAMGSALAALLFGDASPSGKLAETWPLRAEDCASHTNFARHPRQVLVCLIWRLHTATDP